jgi:hypothetical protein
MIVFAAATYRSDTQIGTQLIVGGVSLLSITLTAYTAFASYEDVKLWRHVSQAQTKSNPEEELHDDQVPAS